MTSFPQHTTAQPSSSSYSQQHQLAHSSNRSSTPSPSNASAAPLAWFQQKEDVTTTDTLEDFLNATTATQQQNEREAEQVTKLSEALSQLEGQRSALEMQVRRAT